MKNENEIKKTSDKVKSQDDMSLSTDVKSSMAQEILSAIAEVSADEIKEHSISLINNLGLEFIAAVGIDFVGGLIPGIGNALSSYKTRKAIRNVTIALEEIKLNQDEFAKRLGEMDKEQKSKFDEIFTFTFNQAANTLQEEKIKFIVNGLLNVAKLEDISFDIAYLYFDTLDKLTMLDLAILRNYGVYILGYSNIDVEEPYIDVEKSFGVDYYQVNKIKEKLLSDGLLKDKYEDELKKDIDKLFNYVEALSNNGRTGRIPSNIRVHARKQMVLSSFGKSFLEFFYTGMDEEKTL